MKALFLIDSPHETNLPNMNEIQYTNIEGVLHGGYWIVGTAPTQNTVIVCLDTTEEIIDTMSNDPKYLYIGDCVEEVIDG